MYRALRGVGVLGRGRLGLQQIYRYKGEIQVNPDDLGRKAHRLLVERENAPLTTFQKATKATKEASYISLSIAGLIGAGVVTYTLFKNMFEKSSPQRVFNRTCDLIREDELIQDVLGNGIRCYGEGSANRARNVTSVNYTNQKSGVDHMMVSFHLEGDKDKGDVLVDVLAKSGKLYSLVVVVPMAHMRLVYTKEGKFVAK